MQARRPTLDLEATGQDAFGAAAALHAGLHHAPDLQQAGARVGVGPPVAFIAAHDLGDAQAVLFRQRQQLVAGLERVGQHGRVRRNDLVLAAVGRHLVTDDEAAADRVVHAVGDFGAVGIEGQAAHAVGMEGQGFAALEHQVLGLVEADGLLADEVQVAGADRIEQRGNGLDIDRVRLMAGQAQQHRLVTAVALAGGAQAAVEDDLHACGGL
mmetsp:Transcript_1091/g.2935  ORF Transcript_1091/g.2935 Transcript_1091/m.2935 type:complete len:212 (-) Transcript_1091:689-1324(-)